jgi:hypothetical protein
MPCPSCGNEIFAGAPLCTDCGLDWSRHKYNEVLQRTYTFVDLENVYNKIQLPNKQAYSEDFLDVSKKTSTELITERLRKFLETLAYAEVVPPIDTVNRAGEDLSTYGMKWCVVCYVLGVEHYFGNIDVVSLPKYIFLLNTIIIGGFEKLIDPCLLPKPKPQGHYWSFSVHQNIVDISRELSFKSKYILGLGVEHACQIYPEQSSLDDSLFIKELQSLGV